MRKIVLVAVSLLLASPLPCQSADRNLKITNKSAEDGTIIKGWESVLLDAITFESSVEFTNDALKERTSGILNKNRTATELHKFSLNYEITAYDLHDGISHFKTGLRENSTLLDKISDDINGSKLNIFLDSISFKAGGNWSNTASNIHETAGTTVKSGNQLTGNVSLTFKSCFYELFRKYTVGCPRK